MRGRPATDVLALPLRLHGIELGRPTDALVEPESRRILGFEVTCGDFVQRFVPFSVVDIRADEIALGSALTLIDDRDLDFYRRRSRPLGELGFVEPWVDESGVIHEARSAA